MDRIQLYVLPELRKKIETDAISKNLTISQCAVSVLMKHYDLNLPEPDVEERPIEEIIDTVVDEVAEYVKAQKIGDTFDLLTASKTFQAVQMQVNSRPCTTRATIGKMFSARIGIESLENVVIARDSSGIKKSPNRATLYEII